jgi:hypothetical protein
VTELSVVSDQFSVCSLNCAEGTESASRVICRWTGIGADFEASHAGIDR